MLNRTYFLGSIVKFQIPDSGTEYQRACFDIVTINLTRGKFLIARNATVLSRGDPPMI